MQEVNKKKPRLHWVDVAKGLLIVLVAMVHITGRAKELSISCPAIGFIPTLDNLTFFRMPAFFLLAGFWGKYDISFKDFTIKNAKGLLLPLIVFSYLGGIIYEISYEFLKGSYNSEALEWPSLNISIDYWFVLALFIAKCIYWGIVKAFHKQNVRLLVCFGLYALGMGSLFFKYIPNYAFFKYALIMLIYLPLGRIVKDNINNRYVFIVSIIVFALGLVVFNRLGTVVPKPGGDMNLINPASFIPSLVLCTAGSFVFFRICTYIDKSVVLEFIGRNTLAIYVMHWWIEILAMKVLRSFFSRSIVLSTLATLICIILAVLIPCMISELLNRPKFKWIIGKS